MLQCSIGLTLLLINPQFSIFLNLHQIGTTQEPKRALKVQPVLAYWALIDQVLSAPKPAEQRSIAAPHAPLPCKFYATPKPHHARH